MIFIDIQGFQYENLVPFQCKEIAILNSYTMEYVHKFVEMPISIEACNFKVHEYFNGTTNKIHGLDWNQSNGCDLKQEDIHAFLTQYVTVTQMPVVVNGQETKNFLEKYLKGANVIIDLDEAFGNGDIVDYCPSITALKDIFKSHHCNGHDKNDLNCSLENVYNFYHWYTYCRSN